MTPWCAMLLASIVVVSGPTATSGGQGPAQPGSSSARVSTAPGSLAGQDAQAGAVDTGGRSRPEQPSDAPAKDAAVDPGGLVGYEKLAVTDVFRFDLDKEQKTTPPRRPTAADEERATAGFFKTIVVVVSGMKEWAQVSGHDPSQFQLYVNGEPISITPQVDGVHEDRLYYRLRHPEATAIADRTAWKGILGRPNSPVRAVRVTVGLLGTVPIPSKSRLRLIEFEWHWFLAYVAFLALLVTLFARSAKSTPILRTGPPTPFGPQPFSLGRSQMAWWFLLVASSYVFIWMLTGDAQSPTATVLILLGISAGTAVGAVAIDKRKDREVDAERRTLETELSDLRVSTKRLEEEVKALAAAGSASAVDHATRKAQFEEKTTQLGQKQAQLDNLNALTAPHKSKGFWSDVLSDGYGVSLHRFQMAVWTGILSVIFVASVYNVLSMPEFSTELLGLMGISGGTYLGFKIPETTA